MNTNQKSKIETQTFDAKREGIYKPKIKPAHLRSLWMVKQETGKPITQLVSDALDLYFEIYGKGVRKNADTKDTP
jgi:hypothetical protein